MIGRTTIVPAKYIKIVRIPNMRGETFVNRIYLPFTQVERTSSTESSNSCKSDSSEVGR